MKEMKEMRFFVALLAVVSTLLSIIADADMRWPFIGITAFMVVIFTASFVSAITKHF